MIRRKPNASSDWKRAIAGYLDDAVRGSAPDVDELIAAYPDLADDLRQFRQDHQRILRVANSSKANEPIRVDQHDAATRTGSLNSTPASQDMIFELQTYVASPTDGEPPQSLLGRFGFPEGRRECLEHRAQGDEVQVDPSLRPDRLQPRSRTSR